jgi:hypothetical protein
VIKQGQLSFPFYLVLITFIEITGSHVFAGPGARLQVVKRAAPSGDLNTFAGFSNSDSQFNEIFDGETFSTYYEPRLSIDIFRTKILFFGLGAGLFGSWTVLKPKSQVKGRHNVGGMIVKDSTYDVWRAGIQGRFIFFELPFVGLEAQLGLGGGSITLVQSINGSGGLVANGVESVVDISAALPFYLFGFLSIGPRVGYIRERSTYMTVSGASGSYYKNLNQGDRLQMGDSDTAEDFRIKVQEVYYSLEVGAHF